MNNVVSNLNFDDELSVSTASIEESLKSDFWREASRPFYETVPVIGREAAPLEGAIKSREIAGITFASVSFNCQQYTRDRRVIALSGLDQYLIAVVTGGGVRGSFVNTNVTAELGDICILDLTQSLRCEVSAGGTLSVLIPRHFLEKSTGYTNLHGLVLKANIPMVRLLTAYLKGLSQLREHLSQDDVDAMQESLAIVLAATIRGTGIERQEQLYPLSIALRQRVEKFIILNIRNPNLDVGLILNYFKVSRSHLYRAFPDQKGIAEIIRNYRLDSSFLELTRTESNRLSISQIAFQHGFSDTGSFSRAFKLRFVVTPKEAKYERPAMQLGAELRTYFMGLGEKFGGVEVIR